MNRADGIDFPFDDQDTGIYRFETGARGNIIAWRGGDGRGDFLDGLGKGFVITLGCGAGTAQGSRFNTNRLTFSDNEAGKGEGTGGGFAWVSRP